jgi:membrane-bound lytic murein transglycosylase D
LRLGPARTNLTGLLAAVLCTLSSAHAAENAPPATALAPSAVSAKAAAPAAAHATDASKPAPASAVAVAAAASSKGPASAPTSVEAKPDPAVAAATDEMIQSPDDPDSQAAMDKGAAELEVVRRAEQKAGLLPTAPGAGPRDSLTVGLGSWDPLARDFETALGSSIDGVPFRDPLPAAGGAVSLPELAGLSAEELRAKYDIPVELNDAVIAYIRFFQTPGREPFARWLSRSSKWLPTMRGILEKQGVPLDLVYLSMIESGFNAYAYSFAKASGLWQFMVGTSRRYGLVTDFWVDERRDPIKATVAAGKYLRDLQIRFHGDWYLAWAGYNAGEGKIEKAIRKDHTTSFWRMMDKGRTLRAETKHYVPKLIAAALIAKHPERFGFHVDYESPFEFDEAEIDGATDLRVLATAAGTTVERIRELNPALRRFCTPPAGFVARLPKGTHDTFVAAFEQLDAKHRLTFAQHKIERGDSLGKLARAYGVSELSILRTNGLSSHRMVRPGRVLVIPVQHTRGLAKGEQLEDLRGRHAQGRTLAPAASPSANYSAVLAAHQRAAAKGIDLDAQADAAASRRAPERRSARAGGRAVAEAAGGARATYRVHPGDSLWSIATKFSTTVEHLMKVNRLSRRSARSLQVGQKLAVAGAGAESET